ncbi:hypothetical protein HPP92_015665 [Vanilla planifolia]|uniref:DUF7912 domain-containing protein n=1 Tax=Vanilla planifolia TaxID=51239 RepID=A0A835QSL0_VANPL|nr:hypothetical protein HPP92_015665 [Vanilla planifolia]
MAKGGAAGKAMLLATVCRFQCLAGLNGCLFPFYTSISRPPARTCSGGVGVGGVGGSGFLHFEGRSTKAVSLSVFDLLYFHCLKPFSALRFSPHLTVLTVEGQVEEDWSGEWEEEEDTECMIGDGRDGGGIVLGDVKWGERALSLAREVLLNFGDDIALYGFKVSPKGYVYVRLDKLTNRFGCPGIQEIENFNNLYKKRLDEAGKTGEVPSDLAIEVSSPGAERLLKVPQDLDRFQEMAMWVCYLEETEDPKQQEKHVEKVLILESLNCETERCIFKLANVKENRAKLGKGRPLSKKQKDWRLDIPFKSILRIKLYIDCRI